MMAGETISPNMGLPVPGVGVTAGPTFASDINNCFSLIDLHDHSSGKGVVITPAGLSISSDLPFLNNNATNLRSTRFTVQGSTFSAGADVGCLYVTGVDLYYRDVSGNNVRITQSGSVSGTSGSIGGLTSPASANYVSLNQTFVWQSAAVTPANMDAGSYIFRNILANSKGVTVSAPAALGVDYNLTLPTLPASQKFMTLDATGLMAAPWSVDNVGIEVSGGTTVQLKDGGVTKPKLAPLGQQVSTTQATGTTTSTSFVAVTNASKSITTTGRPVFVGLQAFPNGTAADLAVTSTTAGAKYAYFRLMRDAVEIAQVDVSVDIAAAIQVPPGSLWAIDAPISGTYTYSLQYAVSGGSMSAIVNNVQLIAYEL